MQRWAWKYAILFGGCLMLPAALAMPPQATPRATQAASSARNHPPAICLDQAFYGPLPGKANYCLGLQKWNAGHYDAGLELIKLAAGWGNKNAQYTLGLIYYGGHHVPVDPALGIAWLKLADQRHNDPQISLAARSAIKSATLAQRERADAIYARMLPTYGDKVATARAWRHLQHWRRSHDGNNNGCIYLVGEEAYKALQLGLAHVKQDATNPNELPKFRVCMRLKTRRHVMHHTVEQYFHDWMGTVSVGPLKAVPAPAASSGH